VVVVFSNFLPDAIFKRKRTMVLRAATAQPWLARSRRALRRMALMVGMESHLEAVPVGSLAAFW